MPLLIEIAGVNMRIVGGAFREAHWHVADEWAYMLTGKARITLFGSDGSMFVDDVQEGIYGTFLRASLIPLKVWNRMAASFS